MKIGKLVLKGVLACAGLYLALITYMVITASNAIYRFDAVKPSGPPPAPFEKIETDAFTGWYASGDGNPVLVAVGNTGRIADGAERAAPLIEAGHDVLVLSYPGR
jgi:sulfite reductase beta subunit-like hemoprotein